MQKQKQESLGKRKAKEKARYNLLNKINALTDTYLIRLRYKCEISLPQ